MNEQSGSNRLHCMSSIWKPAQKVIEFGGWLMPVQYTGIVAEHKMVRQELGFSTYLIWVVCICPDLRQRVFQFLATNDVTKLSEGGAVLLLCNKAGGVQTISWSTGWPIASICWLLTPRTGKGVGGWRRSRLVLSKTQSLRNRYR